MIRKHRNDKKVTAYGRRRMRVETLESRQLLAADPIHVGVVYLETDYLESDVGSDSHGDRFLVSFTGGAPGTRLTELTIRTDKDSDGISVGDPIYDTELGGRGKNGAHGFAITPGQTENATAQVSDGGQELILRFDDFQVGDRLEFTLDVDEVLRLVPDLDQFNQRLDVITSGQEFQDSILEAVFDAPNYHEAVATDIFLNDYGDPNAAFGLDLPPDQSNDVDSRPNRSAAAVGTVIQSPQVASISGYVYRDDNNSGTRDAGETGLGGVLMRLQPIDTIEPQSILTTRTESDGSYRFEQLMPGQYRIVEVEQPSGLEDGLDAAGTITGRVVGSALNPGDEIRDITLNGGDAGIEYNFGEVPLGSITGSVYLARPGEDCDGTHGPGDGIPLEDVVVQLHGENGQIVAVTTTNAQGQYRFDDVFAGVYDIVEITPAGLLDGGAHVGAIRTLASQVLVGIGSEVDGGRIADLDLPPGGQAEEYDFCEAAPASLSGHVYHDRDNDGQRETGEEAIPGTTLRLVNSQGQTVATTSTDNSGFYRFAGLVADTYRIIETQPSGFIDGIDTVGTIDGQTVGNQGLDDDSLVDIVLRQGLDGVNYDFGERQLASLSGRVHVDRR